MMGKTHWVMFAVVVAVMMEAGAYVPAKSPLMTKWGEKVTPETTWMEYPRPQMVRENWTCLNGEWDYTITSATNTPGCPTKWEGKILVPFAVESALSGVGRLLEPDQFLWYARKIKVERDERGAGTNDTVKRYSRDDFVLIHLGGKGQRLLT